jgi:hypothetical protein
VQLSYSAYQCPYACHGSHIYAVNHGHQSRVQQEHRFLGGITAWDCSGGCSRRNL